MKKYKTESKLEVVQSFLAGEVGAKLLTRRWSVTEEKVRTWLSHYHLVEASGSGEVPAPDRTISALTVDRVYRTDHQLVVDRAQASPDRDSGEVVDAHVRRPGHCAARASSSAWPTVFGKCRRICLAWPAL